MCVCVFFFIGGKGAVGCFRIVGSRPENLEYKV